MGELMPVDWVDLAVEEHRLSDALAGFEARAGLKLHPVAVQHLAGGSGYRDDPFPRLESHDDYLFGILCLPSSVTDHQADFDELIFVVTHDHVLAVAAHGINSANPWNLAKRVLLGRGGVQPGESVGGNFLLNVLRVAIERLRADIVHAADHIQSLQHQLHALISVHKRKFWGKSSGIEKTISEQRLGLAGFRDELIGVKVVVDKTQEIIARLATDQLDLRRDNSGLGRELFDRRIEIFLSDLGLDARHLGALLVEQHARLDSINELVLQVDSHEQVTATRFMGAIASIMLLPTFLVGLYGQNFANMPEVDWRYGYLFNWLLIVFVTAAQIWFFRRKKWL